MRGKHGVFSPGTGAESVRMPVREIPGKGSNAGLEKVSEKGSNAGPGNFQRRVFAGNRAGSVRKIVQKEAVYGSDSRISR